METLLVSGAIIAVINAFREGFEKNNWKAVAYVVIAGLLGGIAGLYGVGEFIDVGFAEGIFMGLTGSGVYTLAQKIGSPSQ